MNPFPKSTAPYPHLDYMAALDVLRNWRIDCCAKGGCFNLPSREIQANVGVAGNMVRPLLRTDASRPWIHHEDLKAPWIDILGIYCIGAGSEATTVLALGTSSSSLVDHLMDLPPLEYNPGPGGTGEKIRTLRQVCERVGTFQGALLSVTDTKKHPSPELVLHKIESIMVALRSVRIKESRPAEDGGKSKNNSDYFLVCAKTGIDGIRKLFAPYKVAIMAVESLESYLTFALPSMRSVFGTGWLPRIDVFEKSLRAVKTRTLSLPYAQTDVPEPNKAGSALLATAAAMKLAEFGWLPQQMSGSSMVQGCLGGGTFQQTLGGGTTDGDLAVFQLPRVAFPGDGEIRIKTADDRLESSWMQFQTPYPQDEVFVFCDHGANGAHLDDESAAYETCDTPRKLLALGGFHASSVGILRSLFPAMRIDVIGYTPAASRTTRSAFVERLVRLAENDQKGAELLRQEVLRLRTPKRLGYPKTSPYSACIELEGQINHAKAASESSGNTNTDAFPATWPVRLINRLLDISRNRKGRTAAAITSAIHLTAVLFNVPPKQLETLLLASDTGPIQELRLVRALWEIIRAAAAGDADVKRTKGTRYGHLALRKEIALMMRDAVKGRLAPPPLLAEWFSKYVRITVVMPLDTLESAPPQPHNPHKAKPLPGSFQSHRIYHLLFAAITTSPSIKVDLDPLLDHALRALDAVDGDLTRGWFANRISQTNELTAAMMVRTGHLEDFPFGELLSCKTPRTKEVMLATLPSQILVRCILLDAAGRELLAQWSAELCRQVESYWRNEIAGATGKNARIRSETAILLTVFGDHEGIAAAALDCCRFDLLAHPGLKSNRSPMRVFFLPDALADHFRTPVLTKSRGVRQPADPFKLNKKSDDGEDIYY